VEQDDLLRKAAAVLDRLGLQYLVTGSMASIRYGEPRFTNDVDIVVKLPLNRVPDLCRQFPEDEFYVSEEAACDAVKHQGMFNVIHMISGLKVDFIIAKDTRFVQCQLQRGIREQVSSEAPGEAWFGSPEDVILNKLLFFQEGGSEKHLRDISGMVKAGNQTLDTRYVEDWATTLGVADEWQSVLQRIAGQ